MDKHKVDYSVYLVTDSTKAVLGARNAARGVVAVVADAVRGGGGDGGVGGAATVGIVQLRDKTADTATLVAEAALGGGDVGGQALDEVRVAPLEAHVHEHLGQGGHGVGGEVAERTARAGHDVERELGGSSRLPAGGRGQLEQLSLDHGTNRRYGHGPERPGSRRGHAYRQRTDARIGREPGDHEHPLTGGIPDQVRVGRGHGLQGLPTLTSLDGAGIGESPLKPLKGLIVS